MSDDCAYIPEDRRISLARGVPLAERTSGTALMADLSGFTALARALATELGSTRGADELTRQLNAVYGATIAEVQRARGSVICFSGDAITCWFDGDDGLRGVSCGLALQRAMDAFRDVRTPKGTRIPLALKVGVSRGGVRRFAVGAPEIQRIDLIAGRTIDRVSAVQASARAHEVAVASEFESHPEMSLGDARQTEIPGETARVVLAVRAAGSLSPLREIEDVSLPDEVVRPWLLAPVFDRLRGGYGEYLAELRPTTALFVRFADVDFDADASSVARVDAFTTWVQRVVARYGGTVLSVTSGDKGNNLYASFGAFRVHEDDATRAVSAALALRDPPEELFFAKPLQIGISRGQMRVGAYGSATRRTFGALGDETNMAARLMQHAGAGEILVSARVARGAEVSHAFDDRGTILVKGLAAAVQVFSPRARTQAVPRAAAGESIGRDDARRRLRGAVDAVALGTEGRVLIVEGDAGIGKSRMLDDLAAHTESRGLRVLRGGARSVDGSVPYFAWRPVFAQLCDVADPTLDVRERTNRVAARVGPDVARQRALPLLAAVLPIAVDENAHTAQLSDSLRATRTLDALLSIVSDAASERPLAIVLDDAHAFDDSSAALCGLVARSPVRCVQILAQRPVESGSLDLRAALRSATHVVHERLEPLEEQQIASVVARRLGAEALSAALSTFLQERAQGNPFVAEELGWSLRDRGALREHNGRLDWDSESRARETFDVPDGVMGLVQSRIDRLPMAPLVVLKSASVLGMTFDLEAVCAAQPDGAERERVRGDLLELARADVLAIDSGAGPESYSFRHVITQRVTYDLLVRDQQREIHARVANWMQARPDADDPAVVARLAHHWGRADDVPRETAYLERAGEFALRAGAYRQAVSHFERLVEIAATSATDSDAESNVRASARSTRLAKWEHALGRALNALGDLRGSRVHLERALRLHSAAVPASRFALGSALAGQLIRQLAHRVVPARAQTDGGMATRDEWLELARLHRELVDIYYYTDEKLHHLYAATRSLNEAERYGPSFELAQGYITFSVFAGVGGLHGIAERYYDLALDAAQQLDQRDGVAFVRLGSAIYRSGLGAWDRVVAEATMAREIYSQLGDHRRVADCLATSAGCAYYRDDLVSARVQWQALLAFARRHENTLHEAHSNLFLGACALAENDVEAADGLLDAALSRIAESPERTAEIACRGLRARSRWLQGRRDDARSEARAVIELVRSTGGTPSGYFGLEGYAAAAEVLIGSVEELSAGARSRPSRDLVRVRREAEACVGYLAAFERFFPIGGPHRWFQQGRLDAVTGRLGAAADSWAEALVQSERLGTRRIAVRAMRSLAGLERLGGARARRWLDRAEQLTAGRQTQIAPEEMSR